MARTKSSIWTIIISLLLGIAAATIFWLYTPYGHDQVAQQVVEDLKTQPLPPVTKERPLNLKQLASRASGSRFQMVTDGQEVFMVDLKDGRVWRYFHETKGTGAGKKEDEGFLPVPFYYAGKKHFTASKIEMPPDSPTNPSATAPPEKKSR